MVLVTVELARYKVDIAALSETAFSGQGQLEEAVSATPSSGAIAPGQGDGTRVSPLQSKVTSWDACPVCRKVNSHHRQPLRSPTLITSLDEARNKFYQDLHALLASGPEADKMIAFCNFNVHVGTDHATWRGVLGSHDVNGSNDNGLILFRTCAEHRIILTNTFLCLPEREKATWRHPRSRQ
nr:unnamed protein product [Spirometra erinaceieuropaei]